MVNQKDTLTLVLPSDREIVMTRTFNAPRELVFEAHSSCEHLSRWWGRTGSTLPFCKIDFRPGGAWRMVERHADGSEYGFRGEYREIVRPERIVWTFEFEEYPGHVSVDTLAFEEREGRTVLTATSLFDSREDRDAMVQSGMEAGAGETWDRLAEHLAGMQERR
jgi:uncharacterized protein YndB with AHSA1/START domain